MDSPAKTGVDWVARAAGLRLRVRNVVDGQSIEVGGQDSIRKLSPRDGQLLCQFGSGSQEDVDSAVASARRAFSDGRWSKQSAPRRSEVLNALAGLLAANAEEFALLESLDTGKPISDALGFDVPHAVATLRYGAAAGDKLASQVYGVDANSLSFQSRRPAGSCGRSSRLEFSAGARDREDRARPRNRQLSGAETVRTHVLVGGPARRTCVAGGSARRASST